jgi:hypothetical protein
MIREELKPLMTANEIKAGVGKGASLILKNFGLWAGRVAVDVGVDGNGRE